MVQKRSKVKKVRAAKKKAKVVKRLKAKVRAARKPVAAKKPLLKARKPAAAAKPAPAAKADDKAAKGAAKTPIKSAKQALELLEAKVAQVKGKRGRSGRRGKDAWLVPAEMRGLLIQEVVPRLAARSDARVVRSRVVRTTGIPESTLAERVSDLEDALGPLTLAYLPGLEGVDLRLTAWDSSPDAADRALSAAAAQLEARLGDHAYGRDEDDLAAVLLEACRTRGLTVAVAESCTGGLVGFRITAIPGTSAVFAGGLICYDDSLKRELGVPDRILSEHGAVSRESVTAMATAARERFGTSLAAAVSGIAGPDGGSTEKPVGLVWFAFADDGGVEAAQYIFPGSRHDIRARAAQFALLGLLRRAKSAGA